MSRVSFGTDGVRGAAGAWPILPAVARRVGAAAARWAGPGGRVVVGGDTRPSSASLVEAVAEGVSAGGAVAVNAGVVPTAALQIALAEGRADIGVMVTASHNPAGDNGFKVLGPAGRKPDDARSATLEAWIAEASEVAGAPIPPVDGGVAGGWLHKVGLAAGAAGVLRGRTLVVDLANGAAAPHRAALEAVLPARVVWLGTGGAINDGCGSEHLSAVSAAVRASGADAGLAVDGDADRCRLVDASGAEVPGDAITWLLASDAAVTSLAVTVMSTTALEAALPGVRIVRTAVGDRFLREAMDGEGIPLGAEDSGHVLFADHPGGDGVFCGLRALAAAFARAPTLAEAVAPFVPFPRRLTKVRVQARPPLSEVPALLAAAAEGEARLGAGGRVFLRYSGTEDVLRVLVEGADESTVGEVSASVGAVAREVLA